MLQGWKRHFLRQGRSVNGERQEYVGICQDEDSSTASPRATNEEKRTVPPARLRIGPYILAGLIAVLFGALLGAFTWTPRSCGENTPNANVAHGFKSLLPKIEPNISVVFQPDYLYWNMSKFQSEQAWKALGRNGNIYVKNPTRFGLEPGIEQREDYDGFPISAFHQLHCLKRLREGYAGLLNGFEYHDDVVNHVDHCFDYLRQAILCRADMTLEKARVDADGHRRATDGWGTAHQCVDWDEVMRTKTKYKFKYAN
ncbi:hypothetical protein JX266_011645 [Neoarthrinium moseri]|nr:hypothetical protein JX266_011645 [Neoarthrinium moseri]